MKKLEDLLFILPNKIGDMLHLRETAVIDNVDIEEAMNRRATKFNNVKGDVVLVPVNGFISHKESIFSALGLETSSETIGKWVDSLMNNPSVGAIIFDINSPGGTAAGLTGISNKIYSYRGKKPMIAISNTLMASAAYFIGSAADEIVADPDSLTGSIGSIMVHLDYSAYLEKEGIKPTILQYGKNKSDGNPYEPLSDNAKEQLQGIVDEFGEQFVSAVAKNRGVTISKIKSDFGQGQVFKANKAKEIGMVDRIATLEQVIKDIRPNTNKIRNQAYQQLAKDKILNMHH